MVPTPTVNDNVIQALEDERMVSYVPLLVLSEEVIFLIARVRRISSPNGDQTGRFFLIKQINFLDKDFPVKSGATHSLI